MYALLPTNDDAQGDAAAAAAADDDDDDDCVRAKPSLSFSRIAAL